VAQAQAAKIQVKSQRWAQQAEQDRQKLAAIAAQGCGSPFPSLLSLPPSSLSLPSTSHWSGTAKIGGRENEIGSNQASPDNHCASRYNQEKISQFFSKNQKKNSKFQKFKTLHFPPESNLPLLSSFVFILEFNYYFLNIDNLLEQNRLLAITADLERQKQQAQMASQQAALEKQNAASGKNWEEKEGIEERGDERWRGMGKGEDGQSRDGIFFSDFIFFSGLKRQKQQAQMVSQQAALQNGASGMGGEGEVGKGGEE
jgi:hypothetical protein